MSWIWFLIKNLSVVLQINVKKSFQTNEIWDACAVTVVNEFTVTMIQNVCIKFVITIIIIILMMRSVRLVSNVQKIEKQREKERHMYGTRIEGVHCTNHCNDTISYLRLVSVK